MRCQHQPRDLFDPPRKGDARAAAVALLHSYYPEIDQPVELVFGQPPDRVNVLGHGVEIAHETSLAS
jgi:hypothetical protein